MRIFTSALCRILFVVALILGAFGAWEKVAQLLGYTIVRGAFDPWRILEFAAITMIFVVALQLREIKTELRTKGSD